MAIQKTKRDFYDLFKVEHPILKVKYDTKSDELATEVEIQNTLVEQTAPKSMATLEQICTDERLREFIDFYRAFDGFSLGTPVSPDCAVKSPLLRQLPCSDLKKFTELYLPKGKWAWAIDLNKTKTLYRNEQKWLAFAAIGEVACLTIFLDGEHAGSVFLVTSQPHFNILKPIAKSYNHLLERIAKDPAAFFRLTRAYLTIVKDGVNHGFVPVEYIDHTMGV